MDLTIIIAYLALLLEIYIIIYAVINIGNFKINKYYYNS